MEDAQAVDMAIDKYTGKTLRWLVRAVVSTGLIAILLWQIDLGLLGRTITKMHLGWLFLAVFIKGTGIFAGVLRWRLLLSSQGLGLPVPDLAGAYLVGRFFGSFLPSTIGLDAYRTYYAAVRTRQTARSVAVILVEKVIGFFSLSMLMLLALPFGSRFLPDSALWLLAFAAAVPVTAAGMVLFLPGFFLMLSGFFKRRGKRFGIEVAKVSDAVAAFVNQRLRLSLATGLGFVVHGATAMMYVATARAVGAEVSALEILFVGPLMIAATLVPLSIAGIGVREGTYVFFLSRIGVLPEQAALLAFLGFLAGELFSLAGGCVWVFSPVSRPRHGYRMAEVVNLVTAWVKKGKSKPIEEVGD